MSSSASTLRVAFVGSGMVNFGGGVGPWDHATRLETMEGVKVVAIVDPLTEKAEQVLKKRLEGKHKQIYADCKIYPSLQEAVAKLSSTPDKLQIAIVGTPPFTRGSSEMGKDLELQVIRAGLHLFVEKPLSVVSPAAFDIYAKQVEAARAKESLILSVGYMFRYHKAVRKMKEIIQSHDSPVMAFNARYFFAYSEVSNPFWWDVEQSGGPIVEQATHFCDLARYLVGEVDLDSVNTIALRPRPAASAIALADPGMLSKVSEKCELPGVFPKEQNRVPRITASTWRFQSGAIGSLMHGIALHGKRYESDIDVLMDGVRMTLYEPYHPECVLKVRYPSSEEEVIIPYEDDDPYDTELRQFLKAVRKNDQSLIASSYADAQRTYELTWRIRLAER